MEFDYKASFFADKALIVDKKTGICLKMDLDKYNSCSQDEILQKLRSINDMGIFSLPYEKISVNTAYIFVTNNCNLYCQFCSMRSDNKKIEKINLLWSEIGENLIQQLKEINPRKIIISGGEPLLLKELPEILEEIKKEIGAKVILQSNGWLLTGDRIAQIQGNIDSIELSTSHVIYNDNLESILKILKGYNTETVLTFVYEREEDCERMKKIIDLAARYETDFLLHFVDYAGSAADNNYLLLDADSRLKIYHEFAKYLIEKGYTEKSFAEGLFVPIMPSHPCSAYGKMVAVYPNGNIYMCHSLVSEKFMLGNLADVTSIKDNLDQARSSEEIKSCFDINNNQKCKECKFNIICGGFCPNISKIESLQNCSLKKIMYIFNLFFFKLNNSNKQNLENFISFCENQKYIPYL